MASSVANLTNVTSVPNDQLSDLDRFDEISFDE